eukprot:CAMPEP_0184690058 /NCGR_PEP_ID=MMETSP0312-20130426/31005_1 /TAXON_ID=31354 /ORGANISM="Compsopogon coeruleus, Strain SAG 36.94" /LENGTH=53 /DNA_ID=CAMNT_0027147485 /DNA_START=1081 /DNA_END=1242 /DNA_ORIENTATION=-
MKPSNLTQGLPGSAPWLENTLNTTPDQSSWRPSLYNSDSSEACPMGADQTFEM